MDTQNILKNADAISLNDVAVAGENEFCKLWPMAKQGLTVLITVLKNPALVAIINVIIATGDAISSKVCTPGKP